MYKAEKQLLSLSHDEWNRLGEKFGVSGQVAQRKAIDGLERIIWNEEAHFRPRAQDANLDELFVWSETDEGLDFWVAVNAMIIRSERKNG